MQVEISCKKCGQRREVDIGTPQRNDLEEHLHLVRERLMHKPSFECFGGHFEFAPPLPQFWEIHWDTLTKELELNDIRCRECARFRLFVEERSWLSQRRDHARTVRACYRIL